jgi:hypothetical protein
MDTRVALRISTDKQNRDPVVKVDFNPHLGIDDNAVPGDETRSAATVTTTVDGP